jgi:beta-carotene 3-hydroxylase
MYGSLSTHFWVLFIGVGISLYGLTYFLIHDVYIHRRFSWFRQLDSLYSRAILRAHGAHHAKTVKEDGESFGLLVVHPKFFGKRKKATPSTEQTQRTAES